MTEYSISPAVHQPSYVLRKPITQGAWTTPCSTIRSHIPDIPITYNDWPGTGVRCWQDLRCTPKPLTVRLGMLRLHAGMGAGRDLGVSFVDCFVHAADDAGLPADPDFRQVLREYMEWAVSAVDEYNPPGSSVSRTG